MSQEASDSTAGRETLDRAIAELREIEEQMDFEKDQLDTAIECHLVSPHTTWGPIVEEKFGKVAELIVQHRGKVNELIAVASAAVERSQSPEPE